MEFSTIIIAIISLWAWWLAGFYWYKKTLTDKAIAFKARMEKVKEIEEEKMDILRKKEEELLSQSRKRADEIIARSEEKALRIEENAEKDIIRTQEKLDKIEERLLEKEDKLDERKEQLDSEREKIADEMKQAHSLVEEQAEKLSQIAKLSQQEAKNELMNIIQITEEKDIQEFVEKYRIIKKEEADKEAMQIIARVMPRLAAESVAEFTSELIDIPDESYKGKLIGREGRNINFFEKITGVELIVDDTPGVVRISCYEHEKRFIASTALKRLIKDGRINPFYIEKFHHDVSNELDEIILDKWKEALSLLNIPMMNPDVVHYVGKFFFRYSYGQNLWNHSIEVARIAEGIASEMGEDPLLAKKAWLLHDIGKVIAENGESHTAVGADALRKLGLHEHIINAAESHHYDVPMTNLISWIVTAADGISASRPGARFNTKDFFIEKMGELEKLIMSIEGVHKVHIMQAGREIMVYVNPSKVKDNEIQDIIKTIGAKIESQLDYPGIIRMVVMRENKIVEYLR